MVKISLSLMVILWLKDSILNKYKMPLLFSFPVIVFWRLGMSTMTKRRENCLYYGHCTCSITIGVNFAGFFIICAVQNPPHTCIQYTTHYKIMCKLYLNQKRIYLRIIYDECIYLPMTTRNSRDQEMTRVFCIREGRPGMQVVMLLLVVERIWKCMAGC